MADNDTIDYKALYEQSTSELAKEKAKSTLLSGQVADMENIFTSEEVQLNIDATRKEELEDLMIKNPEQWRKEMNKLETEARSGRVSKLQEIKATHENGSTEASKVIILDMFNVDKETPLTMDNLKLDLPKRITDKLDNGEVNYVEFLGLAYEYIANTPKSTKKDGEVNEPNISGMGGGNIPTKNKKDVSIVEQYKNMKL